LNSEDRADPLVSVAPDFWPSTPLALAGATLTDSFLASSVGFFCSDGVATFFGEGFGVAFASTVFFGGVGLGVGLVVGFTEAFGTGVMLGFGSGVETGEGEGVVMGR
jgi:hypothetical protein